MRTEYVTREQLGALLGVSGAKNFQRWEKNGIPHRTRATKAGGARAIIFPKVAALEWLKTHASANVSHAAKKALEGGGPPRPVAAAKAPAPPAAAKTGPSDGSSEWVDGKLTPIAERWTALLNAALDEGDTIAAMNATKALSLIADTRRKEEEAERQRKIEEGELVNAADLTGRHEKILNTLKNNILGVADSVIPAAMGLLRESGCAVQLKKLILEKLKDALRSTATTRDFD